MKTQSTKTKRIIYWISTGWLSLGMVSSGIVQLIQMDDNVTMFDKLGYPSYLLTLLGTWKMLGVIAILSPKIPILKEWAYAGFFFVSTGAIISHMAVSDPVSEIFPGILLLVLTLVSWYFRPEDRKISQI
ncbi:DoxX family protein [Belliella sp. DSM 111904]|uniref:DoxX family protein n=1 Tax=Belliella filtrata TaxID=2923435 RepID=A0ABS9UZ70_9BACT|nr:DoxX family protein [Belliella filtrata]MCH7409443.1 DoxX family protein [Belliella filtrata]